MSKFFSKFKVNILVATLITFLFIAIEQSYRIYNDTLVFNLTIKSFFEQFVVNLLIVSIVSKRAIIVIYTILAMFVWFQLAHFSFYGTWIFPLEYLLFFTEFHEVMVTFSTVLSITIIPTISFIVILFFTIFIIKKIEVARLKIPYLSIFLIIYILFLPFRIFIKDDYTRNNKPNFEHFIAKNTINTLANLFGNVIPKKIFGNSSLEAVVITPPYIENLNPNVDIVLIIGESLHRDYMSLYDYNFDTTPFLNSLKDDKNFLYLKAIGSGVSTAIAIPSIFNMIPKPDGLPQILSKNSCLFKMAKENGFNTYFYSSQSQEELKGIKNYLCTKNVDIFRDGTYFTDDKYSSALDENLANVLDEIDFSKPSFIALQQRASHTPFLKYIPEDFRPFDKSNTNNELHQNTVDYLNTIRYTDMVIEKIINKVKEKSNRPAYIIFTSDHAITIGEQNRNGSTGMLNESIYKVPFFVYSINSDSINKDFGDFPYISHFQISNYLAKILGYKVDYDIFNTKEDYFVCGNDLTGLGGFIKISFDEDNNIIQDDKRTKR